MFCPDTAEGLIIWFPCRMGQLTSVISSSKPFTQGTLSKLPRPVRATYCSTGGMRVSNGEKKEISSATSCFFSVHLSDPCFIAPVLSTSPSVPSLSCTIPMDERERIKDSGSSQWSLLINASASFNLPLNNTAAVSVRTHACLCARMSGCMCMHNLFSIASLTLNVGVAWKHATRSVSGKKLWLWREVRLSSLTGRESFPGATLMDVLLALEETFDTHTQKRNTLLCVLLESDRVHVDSYRMYRSLPAQGCKAPVVTTVCTLTTHWAGSGQKVNDVKPPSPVRKIQGWFKSVSN